MYMYVVTANQGRGLWHIQNALELRAFFEVMSHCINFKE